MTKLQPYEKMVKDAEQNLLERKARAFALVGLISAATPYDNELDAVEGILMPCDQEHEDPYLILTDSEQNKTYCGRCHTEIIPNNNADPTPYSEAP